MPYIGTSPSNGVRRVHTYTATASQTTFTGASSEGVTLSYADTNYIDVFQNGVLLGSADYTSTSGTSVVLAQGASADDLIVIVVYDVFSVADTVSKSSGGTFDGDVTFAGAFTSQGIDDNADATAITISSDEHVLIGTTTDGTTANGTVIRDAGEVLITRTDNPPLLLNRANSAGIVAEIRLANSAIGYISANSGGMGLYLGGTGSANHLQTYEEGTWTPGLSQYAGSPTFQDSHYTKIGRFVVCSTVVDLDGTSDTSAMAITNVPFVARNTTNSVFGGFLSYTTSSYQYPIRVLMSSNGNQANLYEYAGSTMNYNEFGNNKQARFMFFFFT